MVNRRLVQQAVADCAGLDSWLIAQRMEGWTAAGAKPDAARWHALVSPHVVAMPASQPYPFLLSRPLTVAPETLGPRDDWLVEWRYDGIRAQLVKRAGRVWIWSRDDELLTAHFPDIVAAAAALPDGSVLDGDLLAVHNTAVANNGDIVVARIEDEVTVKRLHRTAQKHLLELLPENPDYKPIKVDLREQAFAIEGISVGVLRRGS